MLPEQATAPVATVPAPWQTGAPRPIVAASPIAGAKAGVTSRATSPVAAATGKAGVTTAAHAPLVTYPLGLGKAAKTTAAPATQATAGQIAPATGAVPEAETVSGRLTGLLDPGADNLYLQQAAEGASQRANARGLLNTSMTEGARTGARIAAAMPIAQADAGLLATQRLTNQANVQQGQVVGAQLETGVSQSNQQADQAVNLANANLDQAQAQFNAGQLNQATLDQAKIQLERQLANQQAAQQAGLANANLQSAMSQFNAGQINQAELDNARRNQERALADQAAAQQTLTQQIGNMQQVALANTAAQNASYMASYDAAYRVSLANLDVKLRTELANLDAKVRPQIQASASGASIYSAQMDAISTIAMTPNLSDASKAAAVKQIVSQMNAATQFLGMAANDPEIGALWQVSTL